MGSALTVDKIVPISNFNKEGATKIFEDVKKYGTKYVFKNNLPECVLVSPERYDKLMEQICDMELYIEAMTRLSNPDTKLYSQEEVMKILDITDKDLDDVEVDIG